MGDLYLKDFDPNKLENPATFIEVEPDKVIVTNFFRPDFQFERAVQDAKLVVRMWQKGHAEGSIVGEPDEPTVTIGPPRFDGYVTVLATFRIQNG